MGRLRLHHRIVIPVALAAIVTTVAAAWVVMTMMSATLESRVQARIVNASAVVGRSDYSMNPAILSSVKAITGADVITYAAGGAILASTADGPEQAGLAAAVTESEASRRAAASPGTMPVVARVPCPGSCLAVYRPVSGRPGVLVAFVADVSEIDAVAAAIRNTMLVGVGLSLLGMVLVSQIVARRVTAPLDDLVAFTRDAAPGLQHARAAAGDDEVGRLAAAFNDMLDRLERSQEALVRSEKLALAGLMAARVAHDIRNPMSSIKMQTQLLREHVRDEHNRALADAVLHDVALVETVISDLIEVARPGDLRVQLTPIADVVHDVLQRLAPQLAYRKIAVDTALDEGLPELPLDAGRFRQALSNVIVNAADAMPTGGALHIAARFDGGGIVLEVCDDGTGVDQAVLDRIFEPFVSTKRDGVGLGLVNAKAVVESHGGRIAVTARAPRGTRVIISLPVAPVDPVSRHSSEAAHG